jgi:hypothetical protein
MKCPYTPPPPHTKNAKDSPGQFSGLSSSLRGATLIWILSGKSFVYLSLILKQLREREMTTFILLNFLTSREKLTFSKCNQKYPKSLFEMSQKYSKPSSKMATSVSQNHLQNVTKVFQNHLQNGNKCIPKPSSKRNQKYPKTIFKMATNVSQNHLQNVAKSIRKSSSKCHK